MRSVLWRLDRPTEEEGSTMELTSVLVEVADHVAVVTLNRPPVNAQDRQLREELIWVFDSLSGRQDVRAVIMTGAGKVFSAGADLNERSSIEAEPGGYVEHNRVTRESFFAVADCAKPVIAAINGAAVGAGYALASCADILIASDTAWIQMPELDRGLAGGAKFLGQHFSRSRSRLLFFTGRKVGGRELHRLGVVDELTTAEHLMPTAQEIAQEIASKSPLAIMKAKAAFNAVEEMPMRDGYRYEQSVTHELSKSADALEARQAYLEKRLPHFTGE